jgi:NADH-quinone oxidoreductase subunit L
MTIPLIILAIMSIVGGFIPFSEFITADRSVFDAHLNYPLAALAVGVGLTGIILAWVFYKKENDLAERFSNAFGIFYKWTFHKFYFDELYMFVTKKIIFKRVSAPIAFFDKKYIDGTMEGIGNKTVLVSKKIKGMQSGRFQDYAFSFIAGAVVLALVFIYMWN